MAYDSEDQIVSAGEPYFRVLQPKTPTSAYTDSSYLRLGSYVAGAAQEDSLVTGLTTTTSTVEQGSKGAKDQAEDAKTNAKGDPGKEYSATSQSATSYTTKPTPVPASPTDNYGILIYSDYNLHQNIKGAGLQKFGKGHVVEVTTADAKYGVRAGKLDIGAKHGIFVKAGSFKPGEEAQQSTIEQRANLELTATGYIKQTAYGPLDEITYGETHKNFHGDAYDEFHGFKESIFHGREHTYKMSGVMQMTLSGELVLKLSTQFALTAGIDTGIRLALDIKVFIGAKIDIVLISDDKVVVGGSGKFVTGADFKFAGADTKVLAATDMKFAPVADMKKVGFNVTVCDFAFTKTFIAADSTEGKALKTAFEAGVKDLKAEGGMTEAKVKTLCAMF